MSTIIQAADRHQNAVNQAANVAVSAVDDYAHAPATGAALKGLAKGREVMVKRDSATQRFSLPMSFSKAEGFTGKVRALANNFDVVVAENFDEISITAAEVAYYATKTGLNLITGTLISRSRIGRVIQEGVAEVAGFIARGVIKIQEFALRLLPYVALAGALVIGIALAVKASPVIGGIAAGIAVIGAIVLGAQQLQIDKLFQVHNGANRELKGIRRDLRKERKATEKKEREATFSFQATKALQALKQRVADMGAFANKHKGTAATAAVVGGLAAGAYFYGPELAALAAPAVEYGPQATAEQIAYATHIATPMSYPASLGMSHPSEAIFAASLVS